MIKQDKIIIMLSDIISIIFKVLHVSDNINNESRNNNNNLLKQPN